MKLRIEELESRCAPVALPVQAAALAQAAVEHHTGGEVWNQPLGLQKSKHDAAMAAIQNTR